jgi:hypothetical protein
MGKTNKATRKELEGTVRIIAEQVSNLMTRTMALDGVLSSYIEYKGEVVMFQDWMNKKMESHQKEIRKNDNKEDNVEDAKQKRYASIDTPL